MKHFVSVADNSAEQLRHYLDVAKQLKKQLKQTGRNDPILAGKTLALIFEKPSLRTRVSFSVGMTQLGGVGMYIARDEVGIGLREPVQDVARVLSSMCDGIQARVFEHDKILGLAKWSTVTVINGLSDFNHPCQAMADLMTIEEHFGDLKGRTIAYIGDANNVARSLAVACGKFNMRFVIAAPPGYQFSQPDTDRIMSQVPALDFVTTNDPKEAVHEADVLYTDTWVSMGQEVEKAKRIKEFAGYQLNDALLKNAPAHAVV